MQEGVRDSMREIVTERAMNYDHHYRTAGWKVERWTKERVEGFLSYAVDVDRGGCLNGNEVQYALHAIGVPNCDDMKILDYCCGTGITAIYFALCGAEVWAFDASPAAINIARNSAQISDVADKVHFDVLDAASLPYDTDFFDAAFCQSALHIVIEYPRCPLELSRVLKPGAKAVFSDEALGYNPILVPVRWARRRKWVACGGRPLRYPDISTFGKPFSQVKMEHFNLLSQVKTGFSRQLHHHGGLRPWAKALLKSAERLDQLLLSALPCLQRYCGKVVVVFTK